MPAFHLSRLVGHRDWVSSAEQRLFALLKTGHPSPVSFSASPMCTSRKQEVKAKPIATAKVAVAVVAPGAGTGINGAVYSEIACSPSFKVDVIGRSRAPYDVYPPCWPQGAPAPNLQSFAEEVVETGAHRNAQVMIFGSRGGQVVLPQMWQAEAQGLVPPVPPAVVINGGCAMNLPTPVYWPDSAVNFLLIGGNDNFRGNLSMEEYVAETRSYVPPSNKTTAILSVNEMTHMPQQSLLRGILRLMLKALVSWKAEGKVPLERLRQMLAFLRQDGWSGRLLYTMAPGAWEDIPFSPRDREKLQVAVPRHIHQEDLGAGDEAKALWKAAMPYKGHRLAQAVKAGFASGRMLRFDMICYQIGHVLTQAPEDEKYGILTCCKDWCCGESGGRIASRALMINEYDHAIKERQNRAGALRAIIKARFMFSAELCRRILVAEFDLQDGGQRKPTMNTVKHCADQIGSDFQVQGHVNDRPGGGSRMGPKVWPAGISDRGRVEYCLIGLRPAPIHYHCQVVFRFRSFVIHALRRVQMLVLLAKVSQTHPLQELEAGATVELLPLSSEAAWHLLRALSIGKRSAEFEVHFAPHAAEEDNRSLRVLARSGPEWVDVSKDWYTGCFVSRSTQGWKLARKLEMDLRDKSAVAVHTFVDALPAALTILQALAAVPGLAAKDHALVCTAAAVDGDSATRLIVHARTPRAWLDPPAKMVEGSFIAYPPGSAASEEDKRVFRNTVHARLQPGTCVAMQCRGPHAAWHALEALALKGLVTAEVEASWVDWQNGEAGGRAIQLIATTGKSWQDFNKTDFQKTALLKAGDQPQVSRLSAAVGAEIHKRGATSIHVFADNIASVHATLKSIASVPVLSKSTGRRVVFVPSLGWASGPDGTKSRRSLRIYTKRLTAS
ncbi:unnamed protein product [Symbiodinium sp. KB8]|nr:unnamed protein product [Symbiodinium sp. KB8]